LRGRHVSCVNKFRQKAAARLARR